MITALLRVSGHELPPEEVRRAVDRFASDLAGSAGALVTHVAVQNDRATLLSAWPDDAALAAWRAHERGPATAPKLHVMEVNVLEPVGGGRQTERNGHLVPASVLSLFETTNALAVVARENDRAKRELERTKRELERSHEDLATSYWHLEKIQEVLPICMNCNRVKTSEARWQSVVDYLREHALFLSHGYCPDCRRLLERPPESPPRSPG